jgi:hypothetical protein
MTPSATRPSHAPSIVDFITDPQLLGLSLSPAQEALQQAIYGLPLSPKTTWSFFTRALVASARQRGDSPKSPSSPGPEPERIAGSPPRSSCSKPSSAATSATWPVGSVA